MSNLEIDIEIVGEETTASTEEEEEGKQLIQPIDSHSHPS